MAISARSRRPTEVLPETFALKNFRLCRQADVVWREIDEEGILLRVSTGDYCDINATGLFIWRQIEQEMAADELATQVAEAFDVSRETAAEDVVEFARELQKREMLVISDGPAAEARVGVGALD